VPEWLDRGHIGGPEQPVSLHVDRHLAAIAGPDAVRVEALAQALGVTRGGFYGHFADRNALLGEMLDAWDG
jgi:AcrR family transcriptional regulator